MPTKYERPAGLAGMITACLSFERARHGRDLDILRALDAGHGIHDVAAAYGVSSDHVLALVAEAA